MIRWISYTQQNIPGNQSFELNFHSSLEAALLVYKEIAYQLDTDDVSMSLYWCGRPGLRENMIAQAKDFADVGCPFDYPDRIIERGPRGGVKVSNT